MESLGFNIQSVEISDFSGGITENVLQGPTTKSFKIENFYITTDHKLAMRPGIRINDPANAQLPSGKARVNGIYTLINETALIANSARHLYYQNTLSSNAWTEIFGPAGNEALQGGNVNSQVTYAEFQRHTYFALDGGVGNNLGSNTGLGVQPSKIYRNASNQWIAKTAGLPRMYSQAAYNQTSLLAQCCALANALQVSFLAHFNDFGGTTNSLHAAFDSTDYNLLNSTPNATDQNSLFTLVGVLNTTFVAHSQDAVSPTSINITFSNTPPLYHWNTANLTSLGALFTSAGIANYVPAKGPNIIPANTTTPSVVAPVTTASTITALQTAASQLDNLYTAFNFHRLGFFNHSFQNDYGVMNRYKPTVGKIGRYSIGNTYPVITPDWTDFINFVNTLNTLLGLHLNSGGFNTSTTEGQDSNTQPVPISLTVTVPAATDLDSAFLLIYWMRAVYDAHINDALTPFYTNMTYTGAATANITAVVYTSPTGGAANTLPVGSYIYAEGIGTGGFTALDGSSSFVAKVLASGSGTATLDRVAKTGSAQAGQSTYSNFHVNTGSNVTPGSTLTTSTASPVASAEQLATGNTTVGNYLFTNSNTQQFDINSWITLANELLLCLAQHNAQVNSHRFTAWPWNILWNSTLKNFYVPTASNVSYAFFYTDYYQVEQNGLNYLVNSNPVFSDSIQVCQSFPQNYVIPTTNPTYFQAATIKNTRFNTITNMQALVNTNETNYDTSNVQYNIYRTINNGQSFYLVSQQANATASYADGTNDTVSSNNVTALNTNQAIYTSGGNVGYDQPPAAKFVEVVNGVMYWGWVVQSGQAFPQRLIQGIQFSPDAAPASFSDDFEDEITGLGRARNNLVVFCKNSIYREGGGFNNQGQGSLVHERISDAIGCLNSKSIVKTEVGLFFAGSDGFYYTDGFQIIKISLEIDKTYLSFTTSDTQKRAIYGGYDRLTRRVWWSVRSDQTSQENDIIYVYYLDYGIKPSGSFTTVRNFGNLQPASFCFLSGVLYIGDGRGYIMRQDKWTKWDHIVSTTSAASTWAWQAIPYEWLSCAIDAGTTQKRKYYTKMHLIGTNSGNVAMQINAIKDRLTDKPYALVPINDQQNRTWGSPTRIWGNNSTVWAYKSKIDLYRRFPSNSLRSDFFQLQIVPATNLAVYSSSATTQSMNFPVGANATINSGAKTATLISPSGYTNLLWPLDVIGMTISFQTDGYVNAFTITAVSGAVITFSDTGNLSVGGTAPWVIRGTMKEQAPALTSITLYYTPLGERFQQYPGKYTTSGAGNSGENPT